MIPLPQCVPYKLNLGTWKQSFSKIAMDDQKK